MYLSGVLNGFGVLCLCVMRVQLAEYTANDVFIV